MSRQKSVYLVTRVADKGCDEWEKGAFTSLKEAKAKCDFERRYDYQSHTEVRKHDVIDGEINYCEYTIVY